MEIFLFVGLAMMYISSPCELLLLLAESSSDLILSWNLIMGDRVCECIALLSVLFNLPSFLLLLWINEAFDAVGVIYV